MTDTITNTKILLNLMLQIPQQDNILIREIENGYQEGLHSLLTLLPSLQ